MLCKIRQAVPESNFRLRLTYSDDETAEVDFTPVIRQGGVLTPLSDPAFFAQVSVDETGRFIF